jgi:DNA-binding transcriptional MerR regulator
MDQLSIGELGRESRLSPKALRLYDELGLLRPARVGPVIGYRCYDRAQLERARLVAALRQIGTPLAETTEIVGLAADGAATRIAQYWATVEAGHAARRELAVYLVDRLNAKRSVMYEVATREIPERSVLCLKRHVEGQGGATALGKQFVAILKTRVARRASSACGSRSSHRHLGQR